MSKRILNYLGLPEKYHGISTIWFIGIALIIAIMMNSCGGCDCDCCESDVTVKPKRESGSAIFEVKNLNALAPSTGTKMVTVAYTGTVIVEGEGTGSGSFSVNRSYEVTRNSVNPYPLYERKNLKPGQWEMRVSVENWNASCQGNIQQNRATRFVFTYGSGGCALQ